MYASFLKNPRYLTQYHLKSLMAVVAMNAVAFAFAPPDIEKLALMLPALFLMSSINFYFVLAGAGYACVASAALEGFNPSMLALFPLSIVWILFTTSLLHNASHDNIKPKFLRRFVGEAIGLCQLVGFPDWVIVHVIHHSHADDPAKDPHPPLNKGYWEFMIGMRESILKVYLGEYFRLYGQTEKSMTELKRMGQVAKLEQFAKVSLFYLLLGPVGFAYFFATSIVFKMLHYAWFNWATHKKDQNGQETILNLNGHFYKLVNFIAFGLYYHGNHHINPKLFDPRNMKPAKVITKAA